MFIFSVLPHKNNLALMGINPAPTQHADYVNGISLFVDGGMTLYPGFATGG
jgi:hypothetical protein